MNPEIERFWGLFILYKTGDSQFLLNTDFGNYNNS